MSSPLIYDLHSHTTCSDGSLTPTQLVQQAAAAGVDLLAITDHDTTAAFRQLDLAVEQPLQIIPAIEFSTTWRKIGVHIVGLNIRPDSDAMAAGTHFQHQARQQRAEQIDEKLHHIGLPNTLAGAAALAGNDNIGRPHFAQHLVNIGAANNIRQAFKKYLGAGKPGDVKQLWATLPTVIQWIRDAGGIPVLAHPDKYNLTRTKLLALVDDFIADGGQAMEVVSGKQLPQLTRDLGSICQQKNLFASCGSDFHQPGQPWAELGRFPLLPDGCQPVWDHW
ncbi:MAG: PHP domain-containing protein [Porticoccaceae bacterium]